MKQNLRLMAMLWPLMRLRAIINRHIQKGTGLLHNRSQTAAGRLGIWQLSPRCHNAVFEQRASNDTAGTQQDDPTVMQSLSGTGAPVLEAHKDVSRLANEGLGKTQPALCSRRSSLTLPSGPIPICPAYTSVKRPKSGRLATGKRLHSGRKVHTDGQGKRYRSGWNETGYGLGSASELGLDSELTRSALVLVCANQDSTETKRRPNQVQTELRRNIEESCVCTHAKAPARSGLGLALGLMATLFLTTMCLYAVKQVSAQVPEPAATAVEDIQSLQIGDSIPEVLWNLPLQVVNHPEGKDTITLADVRGKVIILDFWATWCGSCIPGMAKLDSIAGLLKQDLALLPVTEEGAERAGKFIRNNKLLKSVLPMSVTDGQILSAYFPHRSVPHAIIIDKNGIVKSETLPERLDYENLLAFATTGNKQWHEKFDHANRIFPVQSAYITPTHFYSVFSGAADGLGTKHGLITDTVANVRRFYGSNVSLRLLLTRAVGQFVIPKSHIRLHADVDKSLFYDSLFTYEATFPVQYADSVIEAYLLNDIRRYAGLDAKLEARATPCWVIYRPSDTIGRAHTPQGGTVPLSSVVSAINAQETATPVWIEGPIKQVPVSDTAMNAVPGSESFRASLQKWGLDIRKESKKLTVLTVSQHQYTTN